MSTNVTLANNAVEYHGIAHIQSMTQAEPSNNDADNRRENELLDASGKFAVGNPGGPGRPPTKRFSDAYRRILDDEGADKYARQVATDALAAPKARDRLAAIQEMTDRVEGKAVQNIRHAGVFMVMAPGEEVLNAAFGAIAPSEDE